MNRDESVSNFEALRRRWVELVFLHVDRISCHMHDILAVRNTKTGEVMHYYDPVEKISQVITEAELTNWQGFERQAKFFYGFAVAQEVGKFHFDARGYAAHGRQATRDFVGLGVEQHSRWSHVPEVGDLITGLVHRCRGGHIYRWAFCTPAEAAFVKMASKGHKKLGHNELERLRLPKAEEPERLVLMARLLISEDLNWFLDRRIKLGGPEADLAVYKICLLYGAAEFWFRYEAAAKLQKELPLEKRYSAFIPEPAPPKVCINRAFAGLDPANFRMVRP